MLLASISNAEYRPARLIEDKNRGLGDIAFHLDGVNVYVSADTAREMVADLTDRLTDFDGPVA